VSLNDPWARPNEPGPGEYIPPLPPPPDPATAAQPTYPQAYQAPAYPPAYPPAGYQQYPSYPPYPPPQPVNGLGIAGMVCSIVGVVTCWILFLGLIVSVIGVTLSHVAHAAIKRERQAGEGFAIAGIAVGWVGVALGLIMIIMVANGPGRFWW
jgi:hypothetical protein